MCWTLRISVQISWNFGNDRVVQSIEGVLANDLTIFASPTYKATKAGLIKLFLDQMPPNCLRQMQVIPMMLSAGPCHALAPDLLLKPVLVEFGARIVHPGFYLLESEYSETTAFSDYAERVSAIAREDHHR